MSSVRNRLQARRAYGPVVGGVTASLRRLVARAPWLRPVVVASMSVLVVWSYLGVVDDARDERDGWGRRMEVWVATTDHRPGAPIRAERRSFPTAVVPDAALVDDPSGELARRWFGSGEILVDSHVTPDRGVISLAPEGFVVVAVADPLVPSVDPGTEVVVVSEGVVLAPNGVVTAATDGVIHVAVPADDAAIVAAAASRSVASLLFPAGGQVP